MDKRRNKIETDFEDAALALVMDWSAESDGERLWKEFCTAEQQIPPELDAHCRNQIHKYTKRRRRHAGFVCWMKTCSQAAACLGIILLLAVSLISSVEALRVPVLNFFLRHSPRATTILFQQQTEESAHPLEELYDGLEFFAPEGYTLEMEKIYRDEYCNPPVMTSLFLAFQDREGNLLSIHITPAEGTLNVDTENASVTEMILEGQQAVLIEKSPEISILWLNETQGLLYNISASAMDKTSFMEYVTILAHETRYSNAGLTE